MLAFGYEYVFGRSSHTGSIGRLLGASQILPYASITGTLDSRDDLWTLKAETQVDYNDLAVWRCPNPKTKLGIAYQTCQLPNPIIVDQVVIAVDFSPGTVMACDRETGDLMWRRKLEKYILYPPIATPAGVLVCTSIHLWMLEPRTGKALWTGPYNPSTSPRCVGDLVIIGDQNGILDCFDVANGKHVWSQRVTRPDNPGLNGIPTVVGRHVVIGSNRGVVKSFVIADGSLQWTKRYHRPTWSYGADHGCGGAVVERYSAGSVIALDPTTAEVKWRKKFHNVEISERCGTAQGMVCIIHSNDKLPVEGSPPMRYSPEHIVGLVGGVEQWRIEYDPWPLCRPVYSDETGLVYEATSHGLGILDPVTGRRLYCITGFPHASGLPDQRVDAPLALDGFLYCHHRDGSLIALRHP